MRPSPISDDEFDRRVAFFISVGRSAKTDGRRTLGVFFDILNSPALDPADRPAVRAARAICVRGGGKWVDRNTERERRDFYNPL